MPQARRDDGILIIRPMEIIDSLAAHEFEQFLDQSLADEDTLVLIDFESVRYISSAGLRCILKTSKALRARGGVLALSSMSDGVRSVFAVSGFDSIFHIHASVGEALSWMNSESRTDAGETETLLPPSVRRRSEQGS